MKFTEWTRLICADLSVVYNQNKAQWESKIAKRLRSCVDHEVCMTSRNLKNEKAYIVGIGSTPNEALEDLFKKLPGKKITFGFPKTNSDIYHIPADLTIN